MTKNEKTFYIWAGIALVGLITIPIGKALDVKRDRIKAEAAEARRKDHERAMAGLDTLREHLDRQLITAKFWEQVTRD